MTLNKSQKGEVTMTKRKMTEEHKLKMKLAREAAKLSPRMTKKVFQIGELNSQEKQEIENVSRWLPSKIGIFSLCFTGKNRRAAIRAKCLQCSCYQINEVTNCTVTSCALFRYRPMHKKIEKHEKST